MKRWLLSLFFFFFFLPINEIYSQKEENLQINPNDFEQSLPILQDSLIDNDSIQNSRLSSNIFWFFIFILLFSLVCFILLRVLRRVNFSSNSSNLDNNLSFKVLFKFPMERDKSLKVIEFYSQIFLISETSQNINLISRIEDSEICRQILVDYATKVSEKSVLVNQNSFASLWKSKIERVLEFSQKKDSETEKELRESFHNDTKKKEFIKNSRERLQEF